VQEDNSRSRDDNDGPNENPTPPERQCHRIIEDIAIPPFRLASTCAGIGAPPLKARGTDVLGAQLQIAQRTHEPTASLAASLKSLIRMKKAGCLVRERRCRIVILANYRPEADL